MEWIIGIYIAVGLIKALGKVTADPTDRPLWMSLDKNPLSWAVKFLFYVLMWPLAKG